MKTYKLIAICVSALILGSCEDKLTENASLYVGATPNENVQVEGDVITVKKGTPINFQLKGDPNIVTFFSGEADKQYKYRERGFVDEADVKHTKIVFSIWNQYGATGPDLLRVYISDQFEGLSGENFEADSVLAEKHNWKNLVEPSQLPQTILGSVGKALKYEVDLTSYLGKRVSIAIRYQGVDNKSTQTKIYFENAKIINTTKEGQVTNFFPSSWGLTALNMRHKAFPQTNADLKSNPAYGTVKNNTEGYWNLDNAGTGSFYVHSTGQGDAKPVQYSWLISGQLKVNTCSSDKGTGIKNITNYLNTYSYTYEKAGTYTATFVGRNANFKETSEDVKELTIKVTD